ncbi:hypothetical protein E2C01_030538 [Portunus trituberculatus]|uniref:Uncharacterized protein n=1 Tax=Portunus trituberculatus TaxID=210409 RepID=A0A5B7EUH5_PORTR|nr:hypothetical protein [Portunus trituberculatus]
MFREDHGRWILLPDGNVEDAGLENVVLAGQGSITGCRWASMWPVKSVSSPHASAYGERWHPDGPQYLAGLPVDSDDGHLEAEMSRQNSLRGFNLHCNVKQSLF